MTPITYAESLKVLKQLTDRLHASTERVSVRNAIGRVLAVPVTAAIANPQQPLAAMDGIAVNCMSIPDALVRLRQDQWRMINTGEVLPENFNAVVKIEDVQWEEKIPVLNRKPDLYQNVRLPGEDFGKGTLLLVSDQRLQPQDLSLLIASGCNDVEVYKRPLVSFLPTGSELVKAYGNPPESKIIESNSAMVAAFTEQWGGNFHLMDPVPDEADDLAQMLKLAVQKSDVVVISAGTSKGTKDLTSEVIRLMGEIHFHGVHITPGKPVLLGEVSGKPVLGLPGYPSAAYICSYLFLRRIVMALSHVSIALPRMVYISSEDIPARPFDSFYRVNCFNVDDQIFVRRIVGGASSIAALSRMDGLMHVPAQTPIRKRDGVRIEIVQDRTEKTIAIRGVSDPALEQLLGLARRNLPDHRYLFWEAAPEEALQTIIERSLHAATITTPAGGPDLFETFAKQIQESMYRYRALTRTYALLFRNEQTTELTPAMKVAIPRMRVQTWNQLVDEIGLDAESFQLSVLDARDQSLAESLPHSKWDAILVDVRHAKDRPYAISIREHVDLIVPESFLDLPAIQKLLELLLSEEYWMFVEQTQKGCDVQLRGLIE